jgi:Raf kinase inhibitor-like YbhB/YbcL family protein
MGFGEILYVKRKIMIDIDLLSTAFESGKPIPVRYTCNGDNVSPPLEWRKIPREAKSLVVIADDPDAAEELFVHWVLVNIPPGMQGLPEDLDSDMDIVVGRNGRGEAKYTGPCPPAGETHQYYFRLYVLDKKLELPTGVNRDHVIQLMRGHILAEAVLIGTYGR